MSTGRRARCFVWILTASSVNLAVYASFAVRYDLNETNVETNMPVIIDQKIMQGKLIVEGTRLPVTVITGALAAGMSFDEVCEEYGVTKQQIRECLEYVTECADQEAVYPLTRSA